MHRARPAVAFAGALALFAVACAPGDSRPRVSAADIGVVADTASPPVSLLVARGISRAPAPRLSRVADSLLAYLVFSPVGQERFTAAVRDGRMLVDIGRADLDLRKDSARVAAYREAVEKRATVPLGTTFRLYGRWGAFDVKATAAELREGRIVLRVTGSPELDSIVRSKPAAIAVAFRTDSATASAADSCARPAPIALEFAARLKVVRDSLENDLRSGPQPEYDRLRGKMAITSSQVGGCFGAARAALVVTLKAGDAEWVRERLVFVDSAGLVTPIRISDYRFRAHELLQAFDADGDGVDDLATRATTERAAAISVLHVDLKARRATRLTSGFAREEP